ncbi:MAG: MBL fold metallo-hydrolase [Deltaproteobacteria bacterium]|nr:MBL fold metallo-hydrolase [Deltaproteobacteria bacterium]
MQAPLTITFLGHATCLLEGGGHAVLTDPHFGRRCCGFRRAVPLVYPLGRLPRLSAVCISHAHCDHCDRESFKYIPSEVPIIVPPKMGPALARFINNPVWELAHWVPQTLAEGLTITPVPVRHIGGRAIPGLRYRQTSGYHIALAGRQCYFAGDTSYGTHFREVGHMYTIDCALLPLPALVSPAFRVAGAMTGLEVWQAHCDLRARHCLPIHWGAFGRARVWRKAMADLRRTSAERDGADQLHIVEPGMSWTLPITQEVACNA